MNKKQQIAIASRWTAAMSSKAVTPLKALAEVLDDDVRTASVTGKEAVLQWFKTWPGMPMFRTGAWQEPTVDGDVVTFVNMFDPKAAFYSASVSVTIGSSGKITRANSILRPAPSPLGEIVTRVWGPRAGMESLPDHLASTYGVKVKKVSQLQQGNHGVHRVDLANGPSWVVRVFPPDRPIADVKGDAAVLEFLEKNDFPAERVVADVSTHEGQGVLVTEFIKGSKPKSDTTTQKRLGDLLGRLHSMKGAPKVVRRPAGALHLYTVDHAVRSEIDTARAALEAGAFRGTDKTWERLRTALDSADDFSLLPTALIHPDPAAVNAIVGGGRLRLIDWSGAGYGPRVLGLGLVLSAPTSGKTFKREWVDAIMNAYSAHVSLKAEELKHLEAAIEHRLLIHEVYAWCAGMAMQRKPWTGKYWPRDNEGIAKMSDYIRESWG